VSLKFPHGYLLPDFGTDMLSSQHRGERSQILLFHLLELLGLREYLLNQQGIDILSRDSGGHIFCFSDPAVVETLYWLAQGLDPFFQCLALLTQPSPLG
jgi:hypothetical protein